MKYYIKKNDNIGNQNIFGPVNSYQMAKEIIQIEMRQAQNIADMNHRNIIIRDKEIIYENGLVIHYFIFTKE